MPISAISFSNPSRFSGMFVAAFALAIPKKEQSIFSTGRRASQKLLELIHTFVCQIPGGKERVVKFNQENLWILGSSPDDVRKISSYPSSKKISYWWWCCCCCVLLQSFSREPKPSLKVFESLRDAV